MAAHEVEQRAARGTSEVEGGIPPVAETPDRTTFTNKGSIPPVETAQADHTQTSASDRAYGSHPKAAEQLANPPLPADRRAIIKGDVPIEHIAHRIAYQDVLSAEDQAYLEQQGYKLGAVIHGAGGLDMTTLIPLPGGHAAPVLAFRGTKGMADLVDDVNPAGVGAYQMAANEGLIATTLASLQTYGLPTVTGHSLGGSLAQMTATRFAGMVGQVVTFQSPGIPKAMVDRLDEHNKQAKATGGHEVESRHYAVQGDLIPLAGEAFTSGFLTVIERGVDVAVEVPLGGPLLGEHGAYPLEQLVASGEGMKPWPIGTSRLDARGPASARGASESERTHAGEKMHKFVDALRVGAGRVVELVERMGNDGAAPREAYVHVWTKVRAAIDAGASTDAIVAILDRSKVRDADKKMMIENLKEIASTSRR